MEVDPCALDAPASPVNSLDEALLNGDSSPQAILTGNSSAGRSQYNFRPVNRSHNQITVFLDEDESGDFKPASDFRKVAIAQNKRKQHFIPPFARRKIGKDERPKKYTYEYGRWVGLKKPVILRISRDTWSSPQGKALAKSMNEDVKDYTADDSEEGIEAPCQNFTELQLSFIRAQRLRHKSPELSPVPLQYAGLDPEFATWKDVTFGHPAARGCKVCFEVGTSCSLVLGDKYPCRLCLAEGEECDLILEPRSKRSCSGCTKVRVQCSFRRTKDHKGPCLRCREKGKHCFAAPLHGYTRTGPSLETLYTHSTSRKAIASVSTDHSSSTHSQEQSKYPKKSYESGARHKTHGSIQHDVAQDVLKVADREVSSNREIISKPFVHPIQFDRGTIEGFDTQCDWCDNPMYGILGEAARTTNLTVHQERHGSGELGKGSINENRQNSRMCTECTFLRVRIILCRNHCLWSMQAFGSGALTESSDSQWEQASSARLPPYRWCYVCPQPAVLVCGSERSSEVGSLHEGCGLCLCKDCAEQMVIIHGGNLTSLIENKQQCEVNCNKIRADADFLRETGYMAVCLRELA